MATYKELQKRAVKRGLELSYTSGRNYDSGGYFKIYVLDNQGKEIANATNLTEIERKIARYMPDAKAGWKRLDKRSWEIVNSKYDVNITKENGEYVLDVFNHKIKDNDEAHIRSDSFGTFEEANDAAKEYK